MAETIEQKIERVKLSCMRSNITLATKHVTKASGKLQFVCDIGHKFSKRLDYALLTGTRCQTCDRDERNKKANTDRARKIATAHDATLISDIVTSTKEKVRFVCHQGHEIQKSIEKLSKPPFCGACAKTERANWRKINQYELARAFGKKRGFELLSNEYHNNCARNCGSGAPRPWLGQGEG